MIVILLKIKMAQITNSFIKYQVLCQYSNIEKWDLANLNHHNTHLLKSITIGGLIIDIYYEKNGFDNIKLVAVQRQ